MIKEKHKTHQILYWFDSFKSKSSFPNKHN